MKFIIFTAMFLLFGCTDMKAERRRACRIGFQNSAGFYKVYEKVPVEEIKKKADWFCKDWLLNE